MARAPVEPLDFDYEEDHPMEDERIVCKFCGVGLLHWRETERGWRLFTEKGDMHSCPRK